MADPLDRTPRILYLGSAPTLGDGAIGAVLLGRLRALLPEAEVSLLTSTPDFYAALPEAAGASIASKPRLSPPAANGLLAAPVNLWRFACRARMLAKGKYCRLPPVVRENVERHFAGADFVVHQGGPQWNDRWLARGAVRFHALRLLAASSGPAGRRPVALLGQSFGPFDWGSGPRAFLRRKLAATALERCRVLVARDSFSAAALRNVGVRRVRVLTTTDVAIMLEPRSGTRSDYILGQLAAVRRPTVAVALRRMSDRYPELEPHEGSFIDNLVCFLDGLCQHATPVFVCTGGEEDERLVEDVLGRCRRRSEAIRVEPPGDPAELARVYGACDALVTVRLHPMILAATAGTPSLSISYAPKCEDFAAQVGLDAYQMPYLRFDAARATALLKDLLENRDEIRAVLAERVAELSGEVRETLDDAIMSCVGELS